MHAKWTARQEARGKIVFEVNARISKFARKTRMRKMLNVVLSSSNEVHGTAFVPLPAAVSSPAAASKNTKGVLRKFMVPLVSHQSETKVMPPKKKSTSASPGRSGTFMRDMEVDGVDDGGNDNFGHI